jgi:hypothetical protein
MKRPFLKGENSDAFAAGCGGMHPDKGVITKGWTGWETVQETERLPIRTFNVAGSKSDPGSKTQKERK